MLCNNKITHTTIIKNNINFDTYALFCNHLCTCFTENIYVKLRPQNSSNLNNQVRRLDLNLIALKY